MFAPTAVAAATPEGGGHLLVVYAVYGAAAVGLTIWLAATLFKNGQTFLHDVFPDRPEMGDAVNRLLVVGFFMLNLGYSLLILRAEATATTEQAVQLLINRLGLLLVSLGLIHFVNMAVFLRIRRRTDLAVRPPPIPPQAMAGPGAPPPPPRPRPAAPPLRGPAGALDTGPWVPAGVGATAQMAGAPAGAPTGGADDYDRGWAPRIPGGR